MWRLVQPGCPRLAGMSRVSSAFIAEELREAVRSGYYSPGVALPSLTVLTKRYGAARGTISAALDQLKREGIAVGRPGAGIFVAERDDPEPVYRARVETPHGPHVIETVTARAATPENATDLGVPPGSPILAVTRVTVADDGIQRHEDTRVVRAGVPLVYELPPEAVPAHGSHEIADQASQSR